MPPPTKLLPYPCPICNGKYGGAQIVVFNRPFQDILIRINHYSSKNYYQVKEEIRPTPETNRKKIPRKAKKAYGREGHSFRTSYTMTVKHRHTNTWIPIQDVFKYPYYFDFDIKGKGISKSYSLSEKPRKKSKIDTKPLYDMIKQKGWNRKQTSKELRQRIERAEVNDNNNNNNYQLKPMPAY
jgi:hypothetical protein